METYIRLVKTLNSRGKVIPESKIFEIMPQIKESKVDWYTSLFKFSKAMLDHFEGTNSVSGYTGPTFTSELVWDFDNHDLELVKSDVRELLKRLSSYIGGTQETLKHVSVWFSGGKGFHVYLNTSRNFTPSEAKHVCTNIAQGLTSFDPVIYNPTRLFRLRNTPHNKTGLFKIKVDPTELKNSDFITKTLEKAKSTIFSEDNTTPLTNVDFLEEILKTESRKSEVIISQEDLGEIRGIDSIDFRKAKSIPKCIYALTQGVMVPGNGERNHIFLHLGNFYRNQGHSKDVVHNILKAASRHNKKLYPESEEFSKEEIWNTIIPRVFRDDTINPGGWGVDKEDAIFKKYCKAITYDCGCPIHDEKESIKIYTVDELRSSFDNFASNFRDNIVKTGIGFLDNNVKIARGTTTLLVACSSVGKTSLTMNIMQNVSLSDSLCYFASADMTRDLVYLKLIQRHSKINQDEIFRRWELKDKKIMNELHEIVRENYQNIIFDFSGNPTLEDLSTRIKRIEEQKSKKVKLVVVDYASRLKGPYSDSNANETYNALLSKDIAQDTDCAWIILNQISRASGDGSTPLRTKRVAKGSSAWEESCTNMITMWRPFLDMHDVYDDENGVTFQDKFIRIFSAKNRMGISKEEVLNWDGFTGKIWDMTPEERDYYEQVERKKERLAQIAKNPMK